MKKIGNYEIMGLLGKGGMSTVYKVRHPETNEILALKLLSPHSHLVTLLGMNEIRKRFMAEARVMEAITSPHIVDTLEVGEHKGIPFIVMEYYCLTLGHAIGETYRLENPARMLRVDKALLFARQTLMGLRHLHQRGVVHRDIKPFNLLLTENETLRITDFGLSKIRGEVFRGPPQLLVGSPYYAAPEQEADPDRVDRRADLYSVGVVLYRMLTGWLPVDGGNTTEERLPRLDSVWRAFVLKALEPDRDNRYADADAMLAALDEARAKWLEQMERTCTQLEPPSLPAASGSSLACSLRATPVKVAPGRAGELFDCDELWRPRNFIENRFVDRGDGTVKDEATGLVWQKQGSDKPMRWRAAHRYITRLNAIEYAGESHWRLPTVDELMSLLTRVPHEDDYCIEPIFGRNRKRLWSADRRSFMAAWLVSVDMGYVSWQDFTCRFHVRAVLSCGDAARRANPGRFPSE